LNLITTRIAAVLHGDDARSIHEAVAQIRCSLAFFAIAEMAQTFMLPDSAA